MKQIDNYILEKLHISKNYKSFNSDFDSFKKYLKEYGYEIDLCREANSDKKTYEIFPENSNDGFPCIDIRIEDNYFTDEFNRFENGCLVIYTTPADSYEFDTDRFDVINDDGYAYSENNAKLISEEIDSLLV